MVIRRLVVVDSIQDTILSPREGLMSHCCSDNRPFAVAAVFEIPSTGLINSGACCHAELLNNDRIFTQGSLIRVRQPNESQISL